MIATPIVVSANLDSNMLMVFANQFVLQIKPLSMENAIALKVNWKTVFVLSAEDVLYIAAGIKVHNVVFVILDILWSMEFAHNINTVEKMDI